ncbi:MAG TPA: glycosyltransferase [Phycisphaerales bacterium]|nr:glycosyltransferase [Phycisphaerales bacterium]
MKVLLIHEHGRSHGGGAVTAMYRLHQGLRARGVDSVIACRRRALDSPDIVELPASPLMEDILGRFSWRIGLNDVHCVSTFKIRKFQPFLDADVVNIHGWHTNYFNYLALPSLARRKPIVGTMHDMWSITGHCSQSYDCQRFLTGCGRCPYPDTFPPIGRDATAWEWKLKKRVYDRSGITFVAPSRWLLDLSKQGILREHDVRQIPNPVDTTIYQPRDTRECRQALGLPQDKYIIFFVSVALKNKAKGGDLMVAALDALPPRIRDNAMLLLLGERGEEFAEACGIPAKALGYIHDDQQKAVMYSAADITVQPSRAENQSLVILESMSCAVPVVAFDTGGMGEIVRAGPGGILAEPEDVEQFAQGIATILDHKSVARELGAGGRQSVIDNYSLDLHCERYIKLFEEKIAARA